MNNTNNTLSQRNKSCTTFNPVLMWKHGRHSLVFLTHPIGYGPQNSPKLKDISESSLAEEGPCFQTHCIHLPPNLHTNGTNFSILNSFLSSNLSIIYMYQEWHFIRNTLYSLVNFDVILLYASLRQHCSTELPIQLNLKSHFWHELRPS